MMRWANPLEARCGEERLPLSKGLPVSAVGTFVKDVGSRGWSLFHSNLMFPAAVLRESAILHNIEAMAAYCRHNGVLLCPHAKSTLAPQLFARQLEAGAWGLTAATAAHVMLYRRAGVQRILIANPLVDRTLGEFIAQEMAADAAFEFYSLVDSLDGLDRMGAALADLPPDRSIGVLIDMGAVGGRTGVRSVAHGLKIARALAARSVRMALSGVSAFEGIFSLMPEGEPGDVARMLDDLVLLAERIHEEALWRCTSPVISAGGSLFFRHVIDAAKRLPFACDIVLRSGCYITHDHGLYAEAQRRHFDTPGTPCTGTADVRFKAAIEVWGQVLSRPEPGLALANVGKRDVSYDIGLPLPIVWYRRGRHEAPQVLEGVTVAALNDQHAYLRLPDGCELAVGDYVALGISHPCTTFDKWPILLMVDDQYRVTAGIKTYA